MTGRGESRREAEMSDPSLRLEMPRDEEIEALICDCIELLLPTLPMDQAEVVYAIDVEGASLRSLSEQRGLSLKDVRRHLAEGRLGLQNRFGELHKVCPNHGLSACNCRFHEVGH